MKKLGHQRHSSFFLFWQNHAKVEMDNPTASRQPSEAPLLKSNHPNENDKVETATVVPPIALQCPYCAKESFPTLAALSLHVQTLHGNHQAGLLFLLSLFLII